jgi:ATP-dependent helicase/nuclease subunit A
MAQGMTKAQIQASDPEYSVWVAASAGTGKTTVLTARVLRLLLGGTNPGKILCLTYTKAGAAEMESRIKLKLCSWVTLSEENLVAELTRLSGIVPNNEIIKRARELFLKTLDTPDGIKIQTIHSFCQGLMRRFPLEAGIMPHFKVMDDKTSKELLKEARIRLLSNSNSYKTSVEVASAIKNIFWRIREGTFSAVIEAIIEDRDKFENALEKAGSVTSLQAAIYKLLGVPEGCNEEDIIYQATLEKSFDRDALKNCALGLLEQSRKTFVKLGKILCSWLEQDAANRVQHFDEYKKAFFTQKNEPRKDLTPAKSKVPIAPMLAEQARLQKVSNDIKSTRVAVLSSSMVEIANAILKIYGEEKSSRAFMDYADLIMKSENLLLKDDIAPWVLYKLDGGIDHILLDEAQDTSPQQWNIIDSLCAEFFAGNGARDVERTIFVVGDEKQSIFSFQGAAPHIFNKMQEKFRQRVGQAGKKWRSVRLDESFRSSPVILQAVDAVGESLRAESREPGDGKLETNETIHRDNLKNNEVNSIVSSQHRQAYSAHIAHHKEMFGRVEIWPLIEPAKTEAEIGWVMPLEYKDKQDTRKILAEQIADMIKEWLDSGRILESEGRPVSAGDIIILLRKRRKMADNIISSLKKRGVAVAGHDRLVITEHIAVMDLMALGNFLLLPQDDLSLACVLKSPLIGLSEEKLFEISYKRGGKSLWNALREVQGNENNGNYAYSYLSNLLSKVDFLTPFGLYCHILEALGGRKKLIRRLGYEVNDPVDEFLSMALAYEKSHAPSLQGFLSWLESGKSEIKRDLEQSGSDTVRVMTVHASKGLEAPIIIMPDTISDFATSKDKIFWHEQQQGQGHIMLWPGGAENLEDVCNLIKRNSKDEQSQEYYRLLMWQ